MYNINTYANKHHVFKHTVSYRHKIQQINIRSLNILYHTDIKIQINIRSLNTLYHTDTKYDK